MYMTRHASCCVSFCTNNFRNSPGLAFYRIPKARRIQLFWLPSKEIISKAVSRCILLFFFFFQGIKLPQAHLLPSALHFHVFSFNSTFRFAILGAFFCFFSFFQGIKLPQAHLHSASHFHVFSFNSTFRFATLSCFNPAETFLFSFRHVCLHSRPRK